MMLHLASQDVDTYDLAHLFELKPPYILGSYYYLRKLKSPQIEKYYKYIKSMHCKQFILDSGAFTMMEQSRQGKEITSTALQTYMDEYIQFVKDWECKYYIELDLDTFLGYEKVKKLTAYIEKKVGYNSMPVFHGGYRTAQDLNDMLKKYDYICLSYLKRNKHMSLHEYLRMVVLYAKEKGVKVHGLALTGKRVTTEIPEFYSIDSSSWNVGLRYGAIPIYNPKTHSINTVKNNTKNKLALTKDEIAVHSLREWIKYANYLDTKVCL